MDHRNVVKEPDIKIEIINVAAHLANHAKLQASVATITAISDLIRHLRKCMQFSLESLNLDSDSNRQNVGSYCIFSSTLMPNLDCP